MSTDACCTCASLLSRITPEYDEKTEKPLAGDRRLPCCDRIICGRCIMQNPRFATYCPYCQISSEPTSLPQVGRLPPAYSPPLTPKPEIQASDPPPYSSLAPLPSQPSDSKHTTISASSSSTPAPDVLHFVHPDDSISSLSLAYSVPAQVLRQTNKLFADHLLAARQTILIPGEYYKGGVSLSPIPVVGEEEEIRRGKIRKWMVGCKVSEYDIALLYLEQSHYDLEAAIASYKADEKWEKDHPLNDNVKGKRKVKKIGGIGATGQLG